MNVPAEFPLESWHFTILNGIGISAFLELRYVLPMVLHYKNILIHSPFNDYYIKIHQSLKNSMSVFLTFLKKLQLPGTFYPEVFDVSSKNSTQLFIDNITDIAKTHSIHFQHLSV